MTRQYPSNGKRNSDQLADKLETLSAELKLAVKWQRPSILIAAYHSRLVLLDAQQSLIKKLRGLKQNIKSLNISPENYDIPLILSQHPMRASTIFFVSGLFDGGANAFRALNIRRELFVDNGVRVVFWLTQDEADALPKRALDFWSFRHRIVEMFGEPSQKRIAKLVSSLDWPVWDRQELVKEIQQGLPLREEILSELPSWDSTPAIRAELIHMLAGLHWAQGDNKEALKLLGDGLKLTQKYKLKPLQSRFWASRGLIQRDLGRYSRAIDSYKKSLEIEPDVAAVWTNLVQAYKENNEDQEALVAAQKSLELNPLDGKTWNDLGDLHMRSGKTESAANAYTRAAEILPTDVHLWVKLGHVYLANQKQDKALLAFKKARQLDNSNPHILLSLGMIYRDLGLLNHSVRALYKVTRLNPQDAKPWKILGEIYREKKSLPPARRAYKKALAVEPSDEGVRYALQTCYIHNKILKPN